MRIAAQGTLARFSPTVKNSYSTLVLGLVFESILLPTTEGRWRSDVLERWERLGDRRYRLQLKQNLLFSDGSHATPADLVKSLREFQLSATEAGGWVEVEPSLPGGILEPAFLQAVLFKETEGRTYGTGPFSVVEESAGLLRLKRRKSQPRKINVVELRSFPSQREAFAAALRGHINFLLMPDAGERELLQGVPHLKILFGDGIHVLSAIYNSRRVPEADRKGFAHAVASREIARAFDALCIPEETADPSEALPRGRPLNLIFFDFVPGMRRAGFALRRALRPRIGEFREVSLPEFVEAQTSGNFDILIDLVQVLPPPVLARNWGTGAPGNWSHYSDPAFDAALREGDFKEAQSRLREAPPTLPICRIARYAAIDSRVRNARLGSYDMLETLSDWEVSP